MKDIPVGIIHQNISGLIFLQHVTGLIKTLLRFFRNIRFFRDLLRILCFFNNVFRFGHLFHLL